MGRGGRTLLQVLTIVSVVAFIVHEYSSRAAEAASAARPITVAGPVALANAPARTVKRCAGSPADHVAWILADNCPCFNEFGPLDCQCQLPKSSVDLDCSPVQTPNPTASRLAVYTMKMLVTNAVYRTYEGILDGSTHPYGECAAISMAGFRRLNNLQWLLEDAIARGVPGGFIETGVWKGGACMLAASVFRAYQQKGRGVFLADSFQGIPPVNTAEFPADGEHVGVDKFTILVENSEEAVRGRFERMGFMGDPDYPVQFLKGWFKDTLVPAAQRGDFDAGFAVIRLDGDIYESTWQALEALYPLLHPGGYVILDDAYDWIGCYKAMHDFRKKYGILDSVSPIVPVYHDFEGAVPEAKRGGWWQKPVDAPLIVTSKGSASRGTRGGGIGASNPAV